MDEDVVNFINSLSYGDVLITSADFWGFDIFYVLSTNLSHSLLSVIVIDSCYDPLQVGRHKVFCITPSTYKLFCRAVTDTVKTEKPENKCNCETFKLINFGCKCGGL